MAVDLRDYLRGVIADGLTDRLADGPGWRVESAGAALSWDDADAPAVNGDQVRWGSVHASGLRADVVLDLDRAAGAATLRVTLGNLTERASIPLSAIKPLSLRFEDLPREAIRVRSIGGGLTNSYYPPGAYRENAVEFRPGLGDAFRIESGPDGRSSNRDLPFLQLTRRDPSSAGLIVALEWSAQWYQTIGVAYGGGPLVWEAGIPVKDLTLAPGESLELPIAHLIGFVGDEDAGSNATRRYVYHNVCPDLGGHRPVPPLSYDHWFGVECDYDEPFLRRQVDRAAELGLEYFVLDAGWYAGCVGNNFSQGVGNWERVDSAKFPVGLTLLADYVRSQGLRFGLWFEPERAHRTSDLVREHSDWFFDIGTSYLHLNLALPAAQDYLIQVVGGWIDRLGLAWSRWDYNIGPRPYWERADPTGKIQFAYLAGLYRVLDTLMHEYPNWLVECCASGGRRIDLGTLRRAHSIWFSDHTDDALVCRFMQAGASRFLPGHLLNSAVPVPKGGGDAAISDADVLGRMSGALSFDGDVAAWSPEQTERVARLVATYRDFRHLLVADFYPLTRQPTRPEDGEVVQFVSRDGADAVLLGFGGTRPLGDVVIRPRALDASAIYVVADPLTGAEVRRSGHELLATGLTLPLASGAAIRRLRRIAGQ